MARTDVMVASAPFREDYQLAIVDPGYLEGAVRPRQFLHIDQDECILCEGCVDICPWKCIAYLSVDAIAEATNVEDPRMELGGTGMFVVDESVCTRCALCVDRCPTGVISLGRFAGSVADTTGQVVMAPWTVDSGRRGGRNGYAYGMRF